MTPKKKTKKAKKEVLAYNEAFVIKLANGKYLKRGSGELLDEVDIWRGIYKDRKSAQWHMEVHAADAKCHYFDTELFWEKPKTKGNTGILMEIVKVRFSVEEVK